MGQKAFYLKYRPQKIAELDSTNVREGLEKVLRSGRVPHALLFTGPRGIGKTSAARIFAKAINCLRQTEEQKNKKTEELKNQRTEKQKTKELREKELKSSLVSQSLSAAKGGFEPCNQCDLCREITEGRALDLIEIDAASNRGIDDVRDLREKIRLSPVRAKYKVYIIDEVHMLTTEAFNALLKTLEEPPEHAVFILCTTEPQKLPQTIISRCLRFNFQKARPEEVIRPLERAVKGEGLKVEKGVLEEIAKSVDGSFRDAHKILEQLSFEGKKITLAETKKLLGKIEASVSGKFLSLLVERDTKGGLAEIDRAIEAGTDLTVFVREILDRLRLMMLAEVGLTGDASRPDEQKKSFSLEDLKVLIGLFSRAAREMRTNPIPQLPLELVVVEWAEKEVKSQKSHQEGGQAKVKSFSERNSSVNSAQLGSQGLPRVSSENNQVLPKAMPGAEEEKGNGLNEIKERWSELLAGVRPLNHSVEALLRAARPVEMNGDFLTLQVFYEFHKERLETPKCRSAIEEVAGQILGNPVKLKCVLGSKGSVDNAEMKKDSSEESAESGFGSVPSASPARLAAEQAGGSADIIKTAEQIFGVG